MLQAIPSANEEEIRRLKKAFWVFASSLEGKPSEGGERSATAPLYPRSDAEYASRLALGGSARRGSMQNAGTEKHR